MGQPRSLNTPGKSWNTILPLLRGKNMGKDGKIILYMVYGILVHARHTKIAAITDDECIREYRGHKGCDKCTYAPKAPLGDCWQIIKMM
jgi:hypothetical protein